MQSTARAVLAEREVGYRDNGPGYPPEVLVQERSNIGRKLIHELVKGTLGGQVTIANDHGAVTTLRIRLEEETRT